jgi:hypothetical protein
LLRVFALLLDLCLHLIDELVDRSFSTMALDTGASPKDVQGQMRHTEARVSLYYGKVIPASVKQAREQSAHRALSECHPAAANTW